MKITFVTDTYSPQPNGVATTLHKLVEGLRKIGHQVDIIRPSVLECDDAGLRVPSISLPGYREVRVGLPIRLRLQVLWYRNRPDVIYVATETPLGASAINAARSLGIPCASGFHTNFQQYMAHYRLPILEWATISYLRHVHNRSTSTFVPSRDVIEQLDIQGFKNLQLLPKGVDTELFTPEKRDFIFRTHMGATSSSLVGLYVGRIAPEKNLPLIIKTFCAIKAQFPDFVGVFVGGGPRLEEIRQQYPQFVYAGVQRGEILAKYYASADFFIFPSLTETFGNVTLEAMASGLAVLAFDYAAARQHVTNGEDGYTVPFGDEDLYLARAMELVRDRNLPVVRKNARAKALTMGWDKVVRHFEANLVAMIAKEKRKGSGFNSPLDSPLDSTSDPDVKKAPEEEKVLSLV